MIERIYSSNRMDGQKNDTKRFHKDITNDMNDLNKSFNLKIKEFIKLVESYNIHPNEINGLNLPISFLSFDDLNTTPEFIKIPFGKGEEPLECISNEGEYFEKDVLDKLIRKWFADNNLEYAENTKNTELFYDNYFKDSILEMQKKHINCGDIDKIETYSHCIQAPKIYIFKKDIEPNQLLFYQSKKKFLDYYEDYKNRRHELEKEEESNNRGYIIGDVGTLYKLNGQIIYKWSSKYFWEIYDEYFLLHKERPELFGKGADPLLEELYERFLVKYDVYGDYWSDYEEFKLKIQQQFLYIANEEKGLRFDLFRNILDNGDFEGGLFHSLKHFKSNNITLGDKSAGGREYSENAYFKMLNEAFFVNEWTNCVTYVPCLEGKGKYKFVFYKKECLDNEGNSQIIHFLNTVFYES